MSRVLLSSLAVRGHVNPMLAIAATLVERGHDVTWMPRAIHDAPATPSVRGIAIAHVDWSWLPPGKKLDFAGAARDFDKYVDNNMEWRVRSIEPLVPRFRAALKAHAPDLLVLDGQVYPGVIAATLEHVPFISVFTSPAFLMPHGFECDLTRALALIAGPRDQVFEKHGVTPSFAAWDFVSPFGNLVFALPELVRGGRELPARFELVGPSIQFERDDDPPDFPWDRLDADKPLVYVSFGTVWYSQPDLFRTIAEASARLGAQAVIVAGHLLDDGFAETLPAGTLAVKYAPQLAVLERAAVCVTHAGANTVMEAAYYGVPQLAIPLCTDQPVNAFFVESSGIGLSVPPRLLTLDRCIAALARLLERHGPIRERANHVARAYRASTGAVTAADRVEATLRARAGSAAEASSRSDETLSNGARARS